MDNVSATSYSSPEAPSQQRNGRPSRAGRPCDMCRKRKLKCVKEDDQDRCVLCTFHERECTYRDEPQRRKKRRADAGQEEETAPTHGPGAGDTAARKRPRPQRDPGVPPPRVANGHGKSLLDRTLGLHRTTHFKYIGPGSAYEERLLDFVQRPPGNGEDTNEMKFRRVENLTTFVSRPDSQTLFSSDDEDDIDAIENIVKPYGQGLVDLYFRTVHPSYPVLHKGVFLEKYARSYKEFSPPLLAAVYLLAMDWWEYDRDLSLKQKPDDGALVKAATKALTAVVHRPKLSTVQAGLLLLQRSGGDSWVLTSQIVAVAEELGLHVDCSSWTIPGWEKSLRRRLAWAIFMQDKWSALIHGRPSHIQSSRWRMPRLSLDDFPESARDQDEKEGSTEVDKGRLLFVHLTRLTEIMAEALDTLYSEDEMRNHALATSGGQGLLELVKPIAVKLKEWANEMPPGLRMEDVNTRKLCSNGYLHLSYFVTEIMIHRFIVRISTPDLPEPLRNICRTAAKARLDHATEFVEALRPEHLQAFWWFASAKSLVYICTYGGLLWATSSTTEEADFYRQKLDDFRWSLKVRSKGVSFVTTALQEMEEIFQNINMSESPVGKAAGRPGYVRVQQPSGDDVNGIGISLSVEDCPGVFDNEGQEPTFSPLNEDPDFTVLDLDNVNPGNFFIELGSPAPGF